MSTDHTPKPHCLGLLHQVNEWTFRAAKRPPITDVDYAKLDDALDREAAYERAEVEAYQKDFDTITARLLVEFRKRGLALSEGIRDPSGFQSSSVGRKAEAAKMVMTLSPCCRQLHDKAFENGELPIGWEPDAEFNFPEKPIRNERELTEYLDFVLSIVREQLTERTTDDELLDDVQRELRNARRAMRAFGDSLPAGFNDNPADIHEAERQLELLIDGFTLPSGDMKTEANSEPPKPVERQAEMRAGGDDAGGGKTLGKAGAASKSIEPSVNKREGQLCQRLAYYASRYAEMKLERQLSAQEVYDYWKEYGFDPADKNTENAAELAGYELPDSFSTYKSQLSHGRRAFNDSRYENRSGRQGRSIVRDDEID